MITVLGSLNMDLVVSTPRVPVLGETILGSGFMTAPGGKGANQAVAAARLGGNVFMIGCVGGDIFGGDLIQNLKNNNVNTQYVETVSDCPTGIAMIVLKDGDNFIIVDPGANSKLSPSRVESLEDMIQQSSLLIVQLEIPLNTVEKAIAIAKKHGVKVLLNPAPAARLSDELLSKVDIITPNESECEILSGIKIQNMDDAKKALEFLRTKGISNVLITLGGNGVLYNSENSIIHKPVHKVEVVDTTAAGDSFTGALAVALSEGKSIDDAVDFANVVGTLTVTRRGAQTSLPLRTEVEIYKNQWEGQK